MRHLQSDLKLSRSVRSRRDARHAERVASLDLNAKSLGIDRAYHEELVWPRLDLELAKAAILQAVAAGYTDPALVIDYAATQSAVYEHRVKHAFLSLINADALKFGSSLGEVLPGPAFPVLAEPSL